MADKAIGDLTAASSVDGADLLEIEQGGSSRRATAAQLSAALGAGNVTGSGLTVNNIIIGNDASEIQDSGTSINALGSLAFVDATEFSSVTGLVGFSQLDRTTTDIPEAATVTLPNNSRSYTEATGTLTTIAFSGGASEEQARRLELNVTGGPYTLTIPSCLRLGETGASTSLIVPTGYHELSWEYVNGQYIMADSIPLTSAGTGDVVGPASSVDSEIALFNSTTGKLLKSATSSGIPKLSSGVLGAATQGTDFLAPVVEATIASATTTDLGTNASDNVQITGVVTITSFGSTAPTGKKYFGRFAGILILTHNGTSLILPSAASITTAAGDRFIAEHLGSGNWLVLAYVRADGTALVGGAGGGDFSGPASSVDSEIVLFNSTSGKLGKRASATGIAKVTAGVLSAVTAPSGAIVGDTDSQTLTNKTLTDPIVGTQSPGNNSTKAASTAYVEAACALVGSAHAIYDGASPPTTDIGTFTIVKTGVDLKTNGTTTIFTVPTSRTYVMIAVIVVVTSVTTGGAGTQTFQIKESSGSRAMCLGVASGSGTPVANQTCYMQNLAAGASYTPLSTVLAGNSAQIVTSGTNQAGSTAVSGSVFLTGYYIS